jgi:PAS domain S-box-containing protein
MFSCNGENYIVVTSRDLSVLETISAQLRKSGTLFQMLFNNMEEGLGVCELVFGLDGAPCDYRFVDVNPNFSRQTGIPAEGLVGKKISELSMFKEPPLLKEFSEVALGGFPRRIASFMEPLGRYLSISIISPRLGLFAVIVLDETERKRLESENQSLLDNSMDMICVANFDGYLTKINPSWSRVLGWSEEELLARRFIDLVHPDDLPITIQEMEKLRRGEDVKNFENRYRRKDGEYVWMSWNSHAVGEMIYAVVRDTSEQRAERQTISSLLLRANEHIRDMERLAQLGELVAGVAHEANTALGNSRTAVTFMQDSLRELKPLLSSPQPCVANPDCEARIRDGLTRLSEVTDFVETNVARAVDIIASFKQVSVDQSSEQPRDYNLGEVLRQTVMSVMPRFKHSPYKIEVQCPPDLNTHGSPGPISQILTNLIMNTYYHAFSNRPAGKVLVLAERLPGESVRISVKDDGWGIPEALRGKVFEPFFTTRKDEGGSGLGLSIVNSLAKEKLNGTVRLESRYHGKEDAASTDTGTTFFVEFPLAKKSDPDSIRSV